MRYPIRKIFTGQLLVMPLFSTFLLISALALGETNLDVRIQLDNQTYKALVETRERAQAEMRQLDGGMAHIEQLWTQLDQANSDNQRIQIIAQLVPALEQGRERARQTEIHSRAVYRSATRALKSAGFTKIEPPDPALRAQFRKLATHFGDVIHANLPLARRRQASNLVILRTQRDRLRVRNLERGQMGATGLSTAGDLVALAEQAEMDVMISADLAGLLDEMLVGVRDLIITAQEGVLVRNEQWLNPGHLNGATDAADRALTQKNVEENSPAEDPAYLDNPFGW